MNVVGHRASLGTAKDLVEAQLPLQVQRELLGDGVAHK